MKAFPHASAILLVIILIAMCITWILPAVTFETVVDEQLGISVIDEDSVTFSTTNKVMPWNLPIIMIQSVSDVLSTLLLICVFMAGFAVMGASGMFDAFIGWLCLRFQGREKWLIVLIMTGFAGMGLFVMPHCFIAFIPTMIILSRTMGYDALIGLGIVMFGATTASMTGPFGAVTAMSQNAVGLPIYSGAGVRFLLFAVFHVINVIYLLRYAGKIKKDPTKSYLYNVARSDAGDEPKQEEIIIEKPVLKKRYFVALGLLAVTFGFILYGSTALGFSTGDISAVFLVFGIVVGIVLGFNLSETMRHFIQGIRNSSSTLVVIALAGAVTAILRQGGVFSTIVYYTSQIFSFLPGFLVPVGLLLLVGLLNCVLPSGPAKGIMLMPLLGPVGQLSGVSMQTSVLTYTLGDSFSNYLLPYDATNASFLEAAKVSIKFWIKFVFKLFIIWNIAGIIALIAIYFIGYGPF